MKKVNKKVILGIVALALLLGAGGYTLYAKDLNAKKVEATQVAYHKIILPVTEAYNETEKAEFDVLLTERQVAFEKLDVISLDGIQQKLNMLDKKVNARIEAERIQNLYSDKKAEIEAITIAESANEEETNIFNARKVQVLQMVTDKVDMSVIDAKISELKQTNTDIETRKTNDATAAATPSYSSDTAYYDDSDDVDYPSSTEGGEENPSPSVSAPPTTPAPAPTPETCKTYPDGSTRCTGGDW